ncbi:MAG: PQQ-binding-like beta-propeller repeat protein, partial [Planctomycetaceae bacterium]|nr:PQQ-binding-like beta-propeller repeat protein [Planctomycetaceae bacterium]
ECGRLVSIHKATGKILWKSAEHQAGYGSVAVFEQNGRTLLASLDCEGLRVSEAAKGREVAFHEWRSPFRTNSTTPIVVGDTIYISTGYNVGCGLFRLTEDRLEEIYTSRDMRNHFNNSILWNGYLYGFDGNSNLGRVVRLTCMKYETGEIMWQQEGFGCGSLMIADGKLVILSDRGELVIAAAEPDGFREMARSPILSGRCWTVPVLLNGRVYARNARGTLVCVELPR